MKCQACEMVLWGTSYIVSRINADGLSVTMNLCRACILNALGGPSRNRLDALLSHAGWAQPRLPGLG
jgi:hypothetical protein